MLPSLSSFLSFDAAAAGRGRGGRLDADAEEKEGELQKVSTEAAQAAGGRRTRRPRGPTRGPARPIARRDLHHQRTFR